MKQRLDIQLTKAGLTASRSQAESWIRLGKVTVDGKVMTKPGSFVHESAVLVLKADEQYVSRAGLKLASVARILGVEFKDKVVLDVGSSTGGFTDYVLRRGARKVYAVDVGTDQLHPSLRSDERIELYEKTDIRSFTLEADLPDVIVMDVSFVSSREVLPHIIMALSKKDTQFVIMVKPQFEARRDQVGTSGVVKNDTVRRTILKDFELWARQYFVIVDKADSQVAGARGNKERFYLLRRTK